MELSTSWQLIASGSYQIPGYSVYANTRLYMKYGNRDTSNNRDTVYWEIRAVATPDKSWASYGYGYDEPYSIYDVNTLKASGIYREGSWPNNPITNLETVIASGNWLQEHNNDGSWSTTLNFNGSVYGTSYNRSINISLPTIPRASDISCSSPYIGDTAIITINRKLNTFTDTVTYNIGGITGTIATKTSETVLQLSTANIKQQIYALIPNAKYITGTIYCTTYNEDTQVGDTQSTTFNLYAVEDECKPLISGTIIDTNTDTIALTGDNSKIVKNASSPRVTISATARNSATISSYLINLNDGQTSNLQEATFNTINSNNVTISTTDSRGYTSTANLDLSEDIIDYILPSYNALHVERLEDASSQVLVNLTGIWFNDDFSENNSNELNMYFLYKESSSNNWINGGSITPTINGNTFSLINYSLGNTYDINNEYQFKIVTSDLLNTIGDTTADIQTVTKGIPVIEIGDEFVNVNGTFTINNQNLPTILNQKSNSTTDSYSANYINELTTYSSTETLIGTFDNKPLYRKLLGNIGTLSNYGSKTFDVSNMNIDEVIKIDGIINYELRYTAPLDRVRSYYDSSANNITIYNFDSININDGYVYIEYTKNTI